MLHNKISQEETLTRIVIIRNFQDKEVIMLDSGLPTNKQKKNNLRIKEIKNRLLNLCNRIPTIMTHRQLQLYLYYKPK